MFKGIRLLNKDVQIDSKKATVCITKDQVEVKVGVTKRDNSDESSSEKEGD